MNKQDIIVELKYLLQQNGMSKTLFAQKMGVRNTTVSHWLRGDCGMSLPTYFKMKKILTIKENIK